MRNGSQTLEFLYSMSFGCFPGPLEDHQEGKEEQQEVQGKRGDEQTQAGHSVGQRGHPRIYEDWADVGTRGE